MMEATFTIPTGDFNDEIIERIKSFLRGQQGFLTIHFTVGNGKAFAQTFKKQTREEYFAQLDRALERSFKGENLVDFSPEAFKTLVNQSES